MEHILVYAYCSECERNFINFISDNDKKLTCPYCKTSSNFLPPDNKKENEE